MGVALLLLPLEGEQRLHQARVLLQKPAHVEPLLLLLGVLLLLSVLLIPFPQLPEAEEGREGLGFSSLLVLAGVVVLVVIVGVVPQAPFAVDVLEGEAHVLEGDVGGAGRAGRV